MCLADRLTSPDPTERAAAAWESAELGAALLRALDDPSWSVRRAAAVALGEILGRRWEVRDALARLASREWGAPVLAAAEPAIVACPEIGPAIEHELAAVRDAASEALAKIRNAPVPKVPRGPHALEVQRGEARRGA